MVATYLIATGFTSVYHMSVDTIFICASKCIHSKLIVSGLFSSMLDSCDSHTHTHTHTLTVEDLERNDGKDKPYFMSKKLRKLLNVKNKKHDHTDGSEEVDGEMIELEGSS